MSVNLTLTQKIEIQSGESIVEYPQISTDGYEVISVSVPHGTTNKEVDLGALRANLKLLAIISTAYPVTTGTPNLSVKFHADDEDAVPLLNMLMIAGAGACEKLIPAEADKLFFTNNHASTDAVVKVVVAQDITP